MIFCSRYSQDSIQGMALALINILCPVNCRQDGNWKEENEQCCGVKIKDFHPNPFFSFEAYH